MTRDEYLKHIGLNVPSKGSYNGDSEATQEFMELADAIVNMYIALKYEAQAEAKNKND